MKSVSIHDILLKNGKWTTHKDLLLLIQNKRSVGARQAYRDLKGAYDRKEIQKHTFPDGTVWYGIPEFGPPTAMKNLDPKPSRFGWWAFLDKSAERKDREKERKKMESELRSSRLQGRSDTIMAKHVLDVELATEQKYPTFRQYVAIDKKIREEYASKEEKIRKKYGF